MSSEDFTQYRIFLNNFAYSLDEIWNIKYGSYSIDDNEIVAEAIHFTLQYLNEGQCPSSLVTPITNNVASEIQNKDRKTENKEEFNFRSGNYKAPEVKRLVFEILKEYCSNLSDNVELNKILALTNGISPSKPAIYSVASVKNTRRTMEDRYICIEDFNRVFNTQNSDQYVHLYAVFDGHNGHNAACYSASHLPYNIAKDPSYPSNPVEALRKAFVVTDRNFVKKNIKSGTTALCALYYPNESKLLIAWVGDSKAMLVKNGSTMQLVTPHKPNVKEEAERIVRQGGSIMMWGGTPRVKGLLNLSRALGDICCKPFVISYPDVKCIKLDKEEDFLILASDGLWDHLSEEESALAVYERLKEKDENSVANHLVELAKNRGSTDNITVIVVFLKKPSLINKSDNLKTETELKIEKGESKTNMDMDTFDNRYSSDLNLDNTQTLVPNANTELDIKTGSGKDIFQKDSLYNDGLNNFVDPLERSSNDTNNPFTTTTNTGNLDTTTNNDVLIQDKNNIDLLSEFDRESEYHQQNNHYNNHHHHHQNNGDDIDEILNDHDHHHDMEIINQKLNNDDKLLFENDMGPETSVDITDDVMMMTIENSETTDLLEHSALSHSKETLPSSDNMNPFDIKNSINDFGNTIIDETQNNIEESSTRTPTSPFEDSSPIVPVQLSETEQQFKQLQEQDQQQQDQQEHLIMDNNEIGPHNDDTIGNDYEDEICDLTNKFDSMIVHDIKETEQELIHDDDHGSHSHDDVKEKNDMDRESIEEEKDVDNKLEMQNEKHTEEILKYDDHHFIDNNDDAMRDKGYQEHYEPQEHYEHYEYQEHHEHQEHHEQEHQEKEINHLKQENEQEHQEEEVNHLKQEQQQDLVENNEYNHLYHDQDREQYYMDNKENECNKENEYLINNVYKNDDRMNETEFLSSVTNSNIANTLIDDEQYQQEQQQQTHPQEEQFENISMMQSFNNTGIENSIPNIDGNNDVHQQLHENNIHNQQEKHEEEDQQQQQVEEFEKYQLESKEFERLEPKQDDESQQHQKLEDELEICQEQEKQQQQHNEYFNHETYPQDQQILLEDDTKAADFRNAADTESCDELVEEEWKYIQSDNISSQNSEFEEFQEQPVIDQDTELDLTEDMSTQLNPDAKEFVPRMDEDQIGDVPPVNGKSEDDNHEDNNGSDVLMMDQINVPSDEQPPKIVDGSSLLFGGNANQHLSIDDIVAQSPKKGAINMENIQIPDETEFQLEIHDRPVSPSPFLQAASDHADVPESIVDLSSEITVDDQTETKAESSTKSADENLEITEEISALAAGVSITAPETSAIAPEIVTSTQEEPVVTPELPNVAQEAPVVSSEAVTSTQEVPVLTPEVAAGTVAVAAAAAVVAATTAATSSDKKLKSKTPEKIMKTERPKSKGEVPADTKKTTSTTSKASSSATAKKMTSGATTARVTATKRPVAATAPRPMTARGDVIQTRSTTSASAAPSAKSSSVAATKPKVETKAAPTKRAAPSSLTKPSRPSGEQEKKPSGSGTTKPSSSRTITKPPLTARPTTTHMTAKSTTSTSSQPGSRSVKTSQVTTKTVNASPKDTLASSSIKKTDAYKSPLTPTKPKTTAATVTSRRISTATARPSSTSTAARKTSSSSTTKSTSLQSTLKPKTTQASTNLLKDKKSPIKSLATNKTNNLSKSPQPSSSASHNEATTQTSGAKLNGSPSKDHQDDHDHDYAEKL